MINQDCKKTDIKENNRNANHKKAHYIKRQKERKKERISKI